MKNNRIDSFLFAIKKALVNVIMHDSNCDVIGFTGFSSADKFRLFIEEKKKKADIYYLNATEGGIDKCIFFHNCLVNQVYEELSLYDDIKGILHYKKLTIIDEDENIYKFSELPLAAQQKISSFLTIQYDVLLSFSLMLNHSDDLEFFVPVDFTGNPQSNCLADTEDLLNKPKKQYMDEKLAEGDRWLDNQEACLFLKVSKRTLQRYRDNAILPYYYLGNKIYYKYSDLVKLINSNQGRRKG